MPSAFGRRRSSSMSSVCITSWRRLTLGRGDPAAYLEEIRIEAGLEGVWRARQALAGANAPLWETAPERYPLAGYVIRHAVSLGVHSRFLAREARRRWPHLETTCIPFPVVTSPRPAARDRTRGDTFRVGVFGFINAHKRLPVVLRAFSLVHARLPDARLLIAGSPPPVSTCGALCRHAGIASAVDIVGYTESAEFGRLMSSVDLGVNLRVPTLGETSAIVTGLFAHGTPVIVSRGGWYDELPDDAVARIDAGSDEALELAATIEWIARSPGRLELMGAAAYKYASARLSPGLAAEAYVRAVLGPSGRRAMEEELISSLAGAVHAVAASPQQGSELTRRVAAAVRGAGLVGS